MEIVNAEVKKTTDMPNTFQEISQLFETKIARLSDKINHLLVKYNNQYHVVIKSYCEDIYKWNFEKQIYDIILSHSTDANEMKFQIEGYLELMDKMAYSANLMSSTTSMVYNLTTIWDKEVLFSLKKEFEHYVKQLTTYVGE